jgi:hypothetical protein
MIVSVHEYLNSIQPNRDVIPSDCMTFSENANYVIEYANKTFFETFKGIGLEELALTESGEQVIYEGAKLTMLKNKIIGIFEKILAAIKAAYEKVLAFFMSKSGKFKDSIKSLTKEKVEKIADKSYGNMHEYKLDGFKSDIIAKSTELTGKISAAYDSVDKKDPDAISNLRDRLNEEIAETFKIDKDSSFDANVIEVKKDYVAEHLDALKKNVVSEDTKKAISDVYKAEKKTIESIIKSINKTKEGDEVTASAKAANFRNLSTALHKATSKYNDILRRQFVESMMVLHRVVKATEAASDKEAKLEAYDNYVKEYNAMNETFIDICESYIFND